MSGARLVGWLVAAAAALVPAAAAAQVGPFFAAPPDPQGRYRVRVSLAYDRATLDDPGALFLFQQSLRRVAVQQLSSEVDFVLPVTTAFALQAVVPLAYRQAVVDLGDIVISPDEVLPGISRTVSGYGLLDPTLAMSYRVLQHDGLDLFIDAGTRIPLDDNPESNTFPQRLPLSTGQNEIFAAAGANLRLPPLSFSLDYRFGYLPGNAATYLVRMVDDQSYTSGALASSTRQQVRAAALWTLSERWSLRLDAGWSALWLPSIVEQEQERRVVREAWLLELDTRVSLRLRLHAQHTLSLFVAYPVLDSWRRDPFYPIVVPHRGFGLSWRVWSR